MNLAQADSWLLEGLFCCHCFFILFEANSLKSVELEDTGYAEIFPVSCLKMRPCFSPRNKYRTRAADPKSGDSPEAKSPVQPTGCMKISISGEKFPRFELNSF